MTIFYVVLYHIWRERYQIKGHNAATAAVYSLAGLRIILCMMPQNNWLSVSAPLHVADIRFKLCILYPGCAVGGCHSDDRYADDP